MKQLLFFIRKEFYHVFRDKRTLLMLFGIPIVLIVLFSYALNNDVKNIGITILDNAHDVNSEQIINKISSSSYFVMQSNAQSIAEVETQFKEGNIKCALIFPPKFGENLRHDGKASVQIIADGSDPNTATTVTNYLTSIITNYQQELNPTQQAKYQIVPEVRQLFNESQNGSINFIPGIIALVFMIVSTSLTSIAVVREKELGTMEILLVSPFKPIMVLIAKAIPYLLLSLVNFVIILLLSYFLLDVPIVGSLALLFLETIIFIISCLSLGLLISNVTESQQSAMLVSMMGMMMPTMILTGFMFPLENMPKGFQIASYIVPSRYYYIIVKGVMLKGLGITHIWKETLILTGMSALLLILALKNFKTRLS